MTYRGILETHLRLSPYDICTPASAFLLFCFQSPLFQTDAVRTDGKLIETFVVSKDSIDAFFLLK